MSDIPNTQVKQDQIYIMYQNCLCLFIILHYVIL